MKTLVYLLITFLSSMISNSDETENRSKCIKETDAVSTCSMAETHLKQPLQVTYLRNGKQRCYSNSIEVLL